MSHGPRTLPVDWTLYDLYKRIEMPTVPLISEMMKNGMRVNRDHMRELIIKYQDRMAEHTVGVEDLMGKSGLNLASVPTTRGILFDDLRLPTGKRSKITQDASTDDETLKDLMDKLAPDSLEYKVTKHIQEYRRYDKLVDSYLTPFVLLADESSRVYTTIKNTRVVSGRLSSSEPFNLMAIPVDGDEATELRLGFEAAPGYVLMEGDYGQLEMVITAHGSQDPNMMQKFIDGLDIHSETASDMFQIPVDMVDRDKHRYPAKRTGFGMQFGLTALGLLPHLPPENRNMRFAQWFLDRYFTVYPKIRDLIDEVKAGARRKGYVQDMFQRVRWMPEMASAIKSIQEAGGREAFSHYIQGTAQGVIKVSMGHDQGIRARNNLDMWAEMQIHDAMVWEVRENQVEEAAEIMGNEYAHAVDLDVPLKFEIKAGRTWGDMEKVGTWTGFKRGK